MKFKVNNQKIIKVNYKIKMIIKKVNYRIAMIKTSKTKQLIS